MRRLHLIVGLLTVLAFVLSGQLMRLHQPAVRTMEAGPRMMYVSRHIYLLFTGLLNLALGLYLRGDPSAWRRGLQVAGSVLVLLAPFLLAAAFAQEPQFGVAGRTWLSRTGIFAPFGGVLLHLVAVLGAPRIDTPASGL